MYSFKSRLLAPLLCAAVILGACEESNPAVKLDHAAVVDLATVDRAVTDHTHSHDYTAPDRAALDRAAEAAPKDQGLEQQQPDLKPLDQGPPSPKLVGCADATREGFLDIAKFPRIAACGGAWAIKGAHNTTPACNRQAGNSGKIPDGKGCNVTDLCAAGWHVCYGKVDVLSRNSLGCLNIMDGAKGPAFYLARTSSNGAFNCSQDSTKFGGPGTSNDLFGCGDLGCKMTQGACTVGGANCDPLKDCAGCAKGLRCANGSVCKPGPCFPLTIASHDLCKGLRNDKNCGSWCNHLGKYPTLKNTWSCGSSSTLEANNVAKDKPHEQGGVLCCED